jgi:hypothetical protein
MAPAPSMITFLLKTLKGKKKKKKTLKVLTLDQGAGPIGKMGNGS